MVWGLPAEFSKCQSPVKKVATALEPANNHQHNTCFHQASKTVCEVTKHRGIQAQQLDGANQAVQHYWPRDSECFFILVFHDLSRRFFSLAAAALEGKLKMSLLVLQRCLPCFMFLLSPAGRCKFLPASLHKRCDECRVPGM